MSHPKDTNDLFPAVRFHLRLPEPPQTATPSRGTEPSVQGHTGTSHIQATAPTSLEAACREHVSFTAQLGTHPCFSFCGPSFLPVQLNNAVERLCSVMCFIQVRNWFTCRGNSIVKVFPFIFLSRNHEEFLSIKSPVPCLGFGSYTGPVPKKIFSISEISSFLPPFKCIHLFL